MVSNIKLMGILIHTTYMSIVTVRLKLQCERYKSSGTDQTLAELIQAPGGVLSSKNHKQFNYIWNEEELPQQ
jgi:hypothetical protein